MQRRYLLTHSSQVVLTTATACLTAPVQFIFVHFSPLSTPSHVSFLRSGSTTRLRQQFHNARWVALAIVVKTTWLQTLQLHNATAFIRVHHRTCHSVYSYWRNRGSSSSLLSSPLSKRAFKVDVVVQGLDSSSAFRYRLTDEMLKKMYEMKRFTPTSLVSSHPIETTASSLGPPTIRGLPFL